MHLFYNKASFYGEGFLVPCPTTKLEDHPLSAVRDFLFHIFDATLHIGGCSYIRNLKMCHALVTRTLLSWTSPPVFLLNILSCKNISKLQWLLVSAFCSGRQVYHICNNNTLRSIYFAYFHSIASYGIILGEIPSTVRRYSPYRRE
jgi:hypothetical protein